VDLSPLQATETVNYKFILMKTILTLLIFFQTLTLFAAKVDTLIVYSNSMKKEIKNTVILPNSYLAEGKKFPVLYLLHGAGADYRTWVTYYPEIKDYADMYNFIIVCPDGGKTSWYFDSPIDRSYQYETYISKELVEKLDKSYNTSAKREDRAVMGLSMGGHGAFYLAVKHPDIWSAALSSSGGLDIRPFPNKWDIAKRLGSMKDYPERWGKNTVINMIHLIKADSTKLFFDCGTDDFFYPANKKFHEKLLYMNIQHTYIEMPGGHSRAYWKNSIKYHFTFLNSHFNQ